MPLSTYWHVPVTAPFRSEHSASAARPTCARPAVSTASNGQPATANADDADSGRQMPCKRVVGVVFARSPPAAGRSASLARQHALPLSRPLCLSRSLALFRCESTAFGAADTQSRSDWRDVSKRRAELAGARSASFAWRQAGVGCGAGIAATPHSKPKRKAGPRDVRRRRRGA
eukprot:3023740-Rhodomonas_salina.1